MKNVRLIEKTRHRPEIDGLRAVAVLAVVFYHAGFACPGGYVGVDVFFVISGYLITSLIGSDLESNRFTFTGFWERRIRRILPALAVVILATLAAGWFLLLPDDLEQLGRSVTSQSLLSANIHCWLDSGYFAGSSDEKPLLHTWSLAVEEQFYLVMPFLIWGLFQFQKFRRRGVLVAILSSGFLLSLVLSVYGLSRWPSATFYLLPTRAWELLMGSLLALVPLNYPGSRSRLLRELMAASGLVMILVAVFKYHALTPFPGAAALLPCSGTALFILANQREGESVPTTMGAVLSFRPFVFIGLISYSLYLWHWPLLAYGKYLAQAPFPPVTTVHRICLVGLGFGLAVLSWRYVETPFRKRTLCKSRQSIFNLAFVTWGLILCSGILCVTWHGFPRRLPPEAIEYAQAKLDGSFPKDLTLDDILSDRLIPLGESNANIRPTVLMWGDSHAMALMPAMDSFLKEKGVAGCAVTHASLAPVLDWYMITRYGLGEKSVAFNQAVLRLIQQKRFTSVILSGTWSRYAGSEVGRDRSFNRALIQTVTLLRSMGIQVWMILDVPIHQFNVPRTLSRSVISRMDVAPYCTRPADMDPFDKISPGTISELKRLGATVLDPKPRFLDPSGTYYRVESGGLALYCDESHLSTKGSRQILLPFFRESISLPPDVLKDLGQ